MTLPRAVRPFVQFPALLRGHGFAISPDQTVGFIEAIGLLGPRDMQDIRRSAVALLAIPHERDAEFDALFRAFFLEQTVAAPVAGDEDDDVEAFEPTGASEQVEVGLEPDETGEEATTAEVLSVRQFAPQSVEEELQRLIRLAPRRLPRRLSYRRSASQRGDRIHMRKALKAAVQRDGEVFTLPWLKRKTRQRRLLLLIDVSGSMKEQSEGVLRFAHALAQVSERIEVFTFGTRLTRITSGLKHSNQDQALQQVGHLVADFDGGTRIGDALQAFLSIPRFSSFARGAAVLILSDGLERGAPDAMVDAIWRLSRVAWRLDWLSPLAADADYQPTTEALSICANYLDSLSDGSSVSALTNHILTFARSA